MHYEEIAIGGSISHRFALFIIEESSYLFSTTQAKNGLRVGMRCAGSALYSQVSTGGKGPNFNCQMGWCSVAFQIIAGSNQKHGRQVTSCILMDLAADGTQ